MGAVVAAQDADIRLMAAGSATPTRVLMARQPILDRRSRVVAYELLYRSASFGTATDEVISAQSLLNAVVEVGLDRLAGPLPAYFNVSPGLLRDPSLQLLPHKRVVIELLETHKPDATTMMTVRTLREQGYLVALDDFTFAEHQMPFLGHVDIVKVDVLQTPWYRIASGLQVLQKSGATLLAEKVEDRAMRDRCVRAGFQLFQGFYFARPETVESRTLPPSRLALMRVLSEVYRPDPRPADVEQAVACDPGLALRLLRMVNSAAMALPNRIGSVRMAVSLLGVRRIQALAVLLAAQARSSPAPVLAAMALSRARMCEELSRKDRDTEPATHFTAGLLSVLDGMLDLPMKLVVDNLPLSEELAEALVNPSLNTPVARNLRAALMYERGDWDGLLAEGFDPGVLSAIGATIISNPGLGIEEA